MAQQTINIGASPNDGTGTPLRTAFQYTNSNFSELYTAVGPSGNNIVVPGSATITGDLTVDTSTLKVDSTNNRVGIGTATLFGDLNIQNGTNCRFELGSAAGGTVIENLNNARNAYLDMTMYADAYIWNRLGSEVMRLNSTGLGVGVVPITQARLSLKTSAASPLNLVLQNRDASQNWQFYVDGVVVGDGILTINNGTSSVMQMTPTGNVGIGVTPSAWGVYKGLQVGYASLAGYAGSDTLLGSNVYFDGGAFRYIAAGLASSYRQLSGVHQWSTAVAGANPGDPLTLLPQMTLDASGNLLVAGTSAYIRAGGRTQIVGGSVVDINTVGNNVGIAFGGASSILPCDGSSTTTDGVANFGSASKRWNTIYASTGTINTSDQNEKQDIADLGDAEKRVAGKIKSLVKKYRFKDAVASKGENARIHVGWIAQDIQNAFSSEGLDASKYGVFCSDTWEENGVQKTRLGLRYDEVLAFVVSVI